jgi:hypothetical protein
MNSLPPRLCPCIGFAGVAGSVEGECGGEVPVLGCGVPAGLKENAGRALTDFCLMCGMDPRRPVGYAWSDIGREFDGVGSAVVVSDPRIGNEKSGLGSSSMGPALEA